MDAGYGPGVTTPAMPTADQVRTIPAVFDKTVQPDTIDENGHMNITAYFAEGAWAPWLRLQEIGIGEDYITDRQLSFFTVSHHIDYLGELRLDERYSVRPALVGRTGKAAHAVSFILDEERDRLACLMEIMYVHVSMESRRSVPIPEDIAAALDGEIARHPWVADVATGLTLRR